MGDDTVPDIWAATDRRSPGDRQRFGEHRSPWAVLGRDTIYVLIGFPVAIVSFVVVVTGLALSVGLAPIWLGFPVGVATLLAARLFATIERARFETSGVGAIDGSYRAPVESDSWARRSFAILRDPQSWLDVLHAVLILPISTITFSVVVAWWASGLGGVTYWIWGGALPDDDDNRTLPDLLHLDVSDSVFYALLGASMLATLLPVVWLSAGVQAGIGRILLGNRHAADLAPAPGHRDRDGGSPPVVVDDGAVSDGEPDRAGAPVSRAT